MKVLIQILTVTAFTVLGDSFLNKAGKHASIYLNRDFLIGLLTYIVTAFVWVYIYKSTKFAISGVVYSVASILMFVLIGVFMFHEILGRTEYLGIGFGAISLILLSRFL